MKYDVNVILICNNKKIYTSGLVELDIDEYGENEYNQILKHIDENIKKEVKTKIPYEIRLINYSAMTDEELVYEKNIIYVYSILCLMTEKNGNVESIFSEKIEIPFRISSEESHVEVKDIMLEKLNEKYPTEKDYFFFMLNYQLLETRHLKEGF